MTTLLVASLRLHLLLLRLASAPDRRRDERGDVPGWVMVTVMSVGLVGAITAIARPELTQIVRNALNQVK